MRFSLATLLLLVLLAAGGCAALINANDLWRQTMVTLALSILLIATLATAVNRSRPFAFGFAVADWIYMLLVFVPVIGLRDDLLTDQAVQWLFKKMHHEVVHQENATRIGVWQPDGRILGTSSEDRTVKLWEAWTGALIKPKSQSVRFENFAVIGHALWLLIVACLGGAVASFLAGKYIDESVSAPAISLTRP